MPRVAYANVEELAAAAGAADPGLRTSGGVRVRAILAAPERPLWLSALELAPGGRLTWEEPAYDHALYITGGGLVVTGMEIGPEGTIIVEHDARGEVIAGAGGATALHFRPAPGSAAPARAGGHIHALDAQGQYRVELPGGSVSTFFADAKCPTCTVSFRKSAFAERKTIGRHSHPEDEILVVTRGAIRLGRRSFGPGAVLAIDRDTQYALVSGPEGMDFLNYRPADAPAAWRDPNDAPVVPPEARRESSPAGGA
jgi:quercetin dioxygenase-like cupin family protein